MEFRSGQTWAGKRAEIKRAECKPQYRHTQRFNQHSSGTIFDFHTQWFRFDDQIYASFAPCILYSVYVGHVARAPSNIYKKNMFSNQSDEPAKYHGTRDRHTILPRRDDTTDPQCNAFGIRALKCRHRSTDLVGLAHFVFSEYSKYKNKQQSLYGNDHFAKCDTKSSSLSFHIFILSSAIVAFFVSSAAWHSATCMILMPTHLYHYYADAFDYAGTVDAVAANGLCSLRMQSLSAAPPHKQTNKSIDCHYCCCWCVVCVCMVCVGMNGSLFSSV